MIFTVSRKKSRSGVIFIFFALICGILAAGLVLAVGWKVSPHIPALAAIQEIQAGDPLTKNMFEEVKLASAGLPEGAISPTTDLSRFVAKHGMSEGDILRSNGVIDLNHPDPALLSSRLKSLNDPSLRAVEVPVEAATGMLSGMKPGDRVDLISVTKTPNSNEDVLTAKTVIKNIPCIGVRAPGDTAGVLIVAVTKTQAEVLVLARESGKLFTSLRPFGEGR